MQIDEIVKKVRNIAEKAGNAPGSVVLATYTKDEFEELRPGEDYDAFKKRERRVAERLAAEGIAGAVAFQEIDSVGFYRYLAAEGLPNNEAARSAYAVLKYSGAPLPSAKKGADVLTGKGADVLTGRKKYYVYEVYDNLFDRLISVHDTLEDAKDTVTLLHDPDENDLDIHLRQLSPFEVYDPDRAIHAIARLIDAGVPRNGIARALDVAPLTVRNWQRSGKAGHLRPTQMAALSALECAYLK